MGFAAYRLKRTKTATGEELGEITVIFPAVEEPFRIGASTEYTMSDYLAYPDFPIEAHIFVHPNSLEDVKKFGFGNVIDASKYPGETWLLNNGSSIYIGVPDKYGISWGFKDASGGLLLGTTLSKGATRIRTGPCVVGSDREGLMSWGYMPPGGSICQWETDNVPCNDGDINPFKFFAGATPIYTTDDPFGDGGISGGGGGTGSFDGTGDDISIPGLPTLSAVDAGFITLFNPSLEQMHSLSSYMWSDLFDVNGWKKLFADPMGAILGLSIVPVAVPNGGTKEVKVGNLPTGVNMTVAASQYVTVDCGTLNVNEYWGAYLDYDPYTKAEIYLPYIGTHPLATDDIMNKPVHVVYHVDILSGACCALVQCGGAVLYSFVGQCASSIPITGDNWTNVINGAINIAGAVGSMVATGGASAPFAVGQIASTAVNTMKPSVEKSGAMGGTGGMLGVQTPYLILTRPRQALPRDQNIFMGYPSFITEDLSSLSGYTEIDSIHLEGVPATEKELSEIESLLKSGVIF